MVEDAQQIGQEQRGHGWETGGGGAMHETWSPRQTLGASNLDPVCRFTVPRDGVISLPQPAVPLGVLPSHSTQPHHEPSILSSLLLKESEKIAADPHAQRGPGRLGVSRGKEIEAW